MRRVTVRVHQDGDWLFRAERTDGQVLFELECCDDGAVAPPAEAPASPPPSPSPSPVNELLDQEEKEFDEVLRAFGRAMPQGPSISRVVEIGAGNLVGKMTTRLHRFTEGDRSEPIYLVDPFIGVVPEFVHEMKALLRSNVAAIAPRYCEGTAAEVASHMQPMNADVLCVSAELDPEAFENILIDWLQHLSPSGMLLSRLPTATSLEHVCCVMEAVALEVADLGHGWFLATRKEQG